MRHFIFIIAFAAMTALLSSFTASVTPVVNGDSIAMQATDQLHADIASNSQGDACACNTGPIVNCNGYLYVESVKSYFPATITYVDAGAQTFDFDYTNGSTTRVYSFPFAKWTANGASFIIFADDMP